MTYIQPSPALRPFVDAIFHCTDAMRSGKNSSYDIFPGPCAWLDFHLDGQFEVAQVNGDSRPVTLPRAGLRGYWGRSVRVTASTPIRSVLVRLRPESTQLMLGAGGGNLFDRHADLSHLWGQSAVMLFEQMSKATSLELCVSVLEQTLLTRIRGLLAPRADIREAVRFLTQCGSSCVVEEASNRLGMTSRNLNLLFHNHVGVSPKKFASLARFSRSATELCLHGKSYWKRLASEEYFDESHFIKEFKSHAGLTPHAFVDSVSLGLESLAVNAAMFGELGDYGLPLFNPG